MTPTVGSLCSGCGGLDSGLEAAGFTVAWQVEIDRACRSVLERHWPGKLAGADILEVDPDQLGPVDLIAGGTPCQDLSVAGRREGLDGERSRLFYRFVCIADSQPAAWVLWENVAGALSSCGGRDFAIVIRELTGFWPSVPADGWRSAGFCVGPKRWCVWRVLDSQHFGVPQRRHRVYVVGGPRNGRCAPEVLLEPDCLPRDSAARREAGESVATLLTGSSRGGGWRVGADEAAGGMLVAPSVAATLTHGVDSQGRGGYEGRRREDDYNLVTARAVQTRGGARMDPDKETFIVSHTLCGEGADASEDGSGRGTPLVAIPLQEVTDFREKDQGGTGIGAPGSPMYTLKAGQQHGVVAYHLAQVTSPDDRANPKPGDPAPTLNCDSRLAIAYQCHGSNVGPMGTLRAGNGNETGGVPFTFDWQVAGSERTEISDKPGRTRALTSTKSLAVAQAAAVRRLAPRECERLQGYPDDWTRWAADGRELSDSARYRMIGNGVTKPVAEWIGRRLLASLHPEVAGA